MFKLKRFAPAAVMAVVAAVSIGYTADDDGVKAKETVYDKPREFKYIVSNSPVVAFAVQNGVVWYATEEILISQPLNSKSHQTFPKIGNIASTGITSIAADPMGRLWVACEAGVAVRNGTAFTSYTDAEGIPAGKVLAVAPGSGGEVWIGTENGAARFRDGSWTKYTTAEGLASNKIQAVIADSKGKIYLGTDKGLTTYDGGKFENLNAKNTGSEGLDWNNVKVLAKEPNKDAIWMTDGPKNINRLEGKNWKRYMEIQDGITSIVCDGRWVWFGAGPVLLRFNGEEWVDNKGGKLGVPEMAHVNTMYRSPDGLLWFGMEKGVMFQTSR